MSELVVDLKAAKDIKLVGGKAYSLHRLINGGFNVPAGFVVTTAAKMKMSDELKSKILAEFDKLGSQKVAVRSSAVAEDGAKDAWAGQFDTFLNVERQGLIEAVEKCWRSANSARAKAYAKDKGIESGGVAVIVQAMVPASVSGVAFSVHPVSQDRRQMVIEAVEGLAEKLVSGTHTPDTYIIDKSNFDVLESHLAGNEPILQATRIKDVADKIKEIEILFGLPVDIEWSYLNKQLFILQARPITTLG